MQGDGSDGESGEARPLFRITRSQGSKPARETGRRKAGRTIAAAVEAALQNLNDSSDDDEGFSRARHVARFKQRKAPVDGEGAPKRAKQSRVKAGSAALEAHYDSLLQEELGPASAENPTVEETSEYLAYLEKLANGEDVKPPKGKGRARGTKRRIVKPGEDEKTHVRKADQVTPEKAEEDDDDTTPLKEARLRHRGGAGKGGGKRGGKKIGGDSESEEDTTGPSAETMEAWEADFAARIDKRTPDNAATAFSIKMCTVQKIRQLEASSYLGARKEGGKLLFDDEKKVNVHFLLGTQKELEKIRQRRKKGEQVAEDIDKSEQQYLRWLVVKALKLRVINKTEMRAGSVGKKRIDRIQKSNRWSLALSSNLAENSDDEEVENEASPELIFKAREKPEDTKENSKEIRKNIRAQIESRVANVSVSSSHDVNLEEMREILTAPSLSFDWSDKQLDDEEGENEMGILEVELPDEVKQMSKRDLFKSQLHRARSFNQAKGLTHGSRTKSNSSLGSAGGDGTTTSLQEEIPRTQSGRLTQDEPNEAEKAPVSKLWERLEARRKETSSSKEDLVDSEQLPAEGGVRDDADRPEASCQSEESKKLEAPESVECDSLENEKVDLQSKFSQVATENTVVTEISKKDATPDEPAPTEKVEESTSGATGSGGVAAPVAPEASTLQMPADALKSHTTENQDVESAPKTDIGADSFEIPEPSKSSELHEQDITSEDWHGVPPTAMWVVSPLRSPVDSFDATPSKPTAGIPAKEHNVEISPTLPMVPNVEISPTLPMVPNKTDQLEISPTLPMVPNKTDQLEISPTMPMIAPADRELEISPTMPMIPTEAEANKLREPADAAGLAKENHRVGEILTSDRSEVDSVPTASRNVAVGALAKTLSQGNIDLQASIMSDDSLSESEGEDVALDADQLEFQQNPEQLRREREWLRHKRKLARQEAKDSMMKLRKRKAIEAVLPAAAADSLDESDAFGSLSGGIRKKKSFLRK